MPNRRCGKTSVGYAWMPWRGSNQPADRQQDAFNRPCVAGWYGWQSASGHQPPLDRSSEPRFVPRLNSMPRLEQLAAVGYGVVRPDQHHRAGLVGKAKDQDFRHEAADLLWREIDDRGDLPADQRVRPVMLGQLRR